MNRKCQLEDKMKDFVRYYNYERYHESINNLTPSEVYYGTGERKLKQRKRIKQQILIERKKTESNYLFKLAQALDYLLNV